MFKVKDGFLQFRTKSMKNLFLFRMCQSIDGRFSCDGIKLKLIGKGLLPKKIKHCTYYSIPYFIVIKIPLRGAV